jgi:hypothetical protein
MTELPKEDVKAAVREVMAEKFETTLGIDCRKPEERVETRKDMEFLRAARLEDLREGDEIAEDRKFVRALRAGARKGGEKIFWWAVALLGTSALAVFWPDLSKHIAK